MKLSPWVWWLHVNGTQRNLRQILTFNFLRWCSNILKAWWVILYEFRWTNLTTLTHYQYHILSEIHYYAPPAFLAAAFSFSPCDCWWVCLSVCRPLLFINISFHSLLPCLCYRRPAWYTCTFAFLVACLCKTHFFVIACFACCWWKNIHVLLRFDEVTAIN